MGSFEPFKNTTRKPVVILKQPSQTSADDRSPLLWRNKKPSLASQESSQLDSNVYLPVVGMQNTQPKLLKSRAHSSLGLFGLSSLQPKDMTDFCFNSHRVNNHSQLQSSFSQSKDSLKVPRVTQKLI
jgi:hypothetical protein